MIIGENYFRNIYINVLGNLSKEMLALQGGLVTVGDKEASEIYAYCVKHTKALLDGWMDEEMENFNTLRGFLDEEK